MNWQSLVVPITQAEIKLHIQDKEWQKTRMSLQGQSLDKKYRILKHWLATHNNSRAAQVQVANYVNALKRGGLI